MAQPVECRFHDLIAAFADSLSSVVHRNIRLNAGALRLSTVHFINTEGSELQLKFAGEAQKGNIAVGTGRSFPYDRHIVRLFENGDQIFTSADGILSIRITTGFS